MARHNIGIRVPEGITESVEEWTRDDGMEFTVHFPEGHEEGDQEVVIGASHEDVGLVTWYGFDTYAEFHDWADLEIVENEED